jgi:hypothetical protein
MGDVKSKAVWWCNDVGRNKIIATLDRHALVTHRLFGGVIISVCMANHHDVRHQQQARNPEAG